MNTVASIAAEEPKKAAHAGLPPALATAYAETLEEFNASGFAQDRKLVEHPKPMQIAEIATIASLLPEPATLVDIGTGTGIVPRVFDRVGYDVICLDQAPEDKTRDALQRLLDLNMTGHFVEVGEAPVPLADGTADLVFAGDVIEHLPHSPRPFMDEVRRILKPGGWCVLTTPNAVRLPVRIKVALGYSNWMPLEEIYGKPRNYGHHKEYTRAELLDLFARTGLTDGQCIYVEDTLRRPRIAHRLSDIRTKNRFILEAGRHNSFDPLNPMEYIRLAMSATVMAVPGFRSSLVCWARKPAVAE